MSGLAASEQALIAREMAALRRKGWSAGSSLRLVADRLPAGAAREGLTGLATDLENGRRPAQRGDPFLVLLAQGDQAGPDALLEIARAYEIGGDQRTWKSRVGIVLIGAAVLFSVVNLLVFLGVGGLSFSYFRMMREFGGGLPGAVSTLRWISVLATGAFLGLLTVHLAPLATGSFWNRFAGTASRLRIFLAGVAAGLGEHEALAIVDASAQDLPSCASLRLDRRERSLAALLVRNTGQVPAARMLAAEFELQARRSLETINTVVPKLLLLLFGVAVFTAIVSVYLPLFRIARAFEG
jgi:hypothetical protein